MDTHKITVELEPLDAIWLANVARNAALETRVVTVAASCRRIAEAIFNSMRKDPERAALTDAELLTHRWTEDADDENV